MFHMAQGCIAHLLGAEPTPGRRAVFNYVHKHQKPPLALARNGF